MIKKSSFLSFILICLCFFSTAELQSYYWGPGFALQHLAKWDYQFKNSTPYDLEITVNYLTALLNPPTVKTLVKPGESKKFESKFSARMTSFQVFASMITQNGLERIKVIDAKEKTTKGRTGDEGLLAYGVNSENKVNIICAPKIVRKLVSDPALIQTKIGSQMPGTFVEIITSVQFSWYQESKLARGTGLTFKYVETEEDRIAAQEAAEKATEAAEKSAEAAKEATPAA